MLTQVYEDGDTVSYRYDNDGALAAIVDSATGRTTTYYYDPIGRLMRYVEQGEDFFHSVTYTYNEDNNLSQTVEVINGISRTTSYTYDDDDRVTSVTADGTTVEYVYDSFGRTTRQETKRGGTTVLTESFTYTSHSTDAEATSSQIATYTISRNGVNTTYAYTYDNNGNILTVSNGTHPTSYVYDSSNQLIRENNQSDEFTKTWEYDNAGNISFSKVYDYTLGELENEMPYETNSYEYGNNGWGDLLVKYNGKSIGHDQVGNPTNDGTWTYEWEHGRQLKSMSNGTTTWNYEYNADGMRTKRTNGTTTYEYIYNGSQLTQLKVGNYTLNFTYDAAGTPLTVNINGTLYYYLTNIQGDVIGLQQADSNDSIIYEYDAWGNIRYTNNCDAPLSLNPLRYRGYVYDVETGLYYLQSRYYDPEIGRFINADGLTSTGQGFSGNNMFAYCGNCPVRNCDPAGTFYIAALQQTRDGVFRESGTADKYTKADEMRERREAIENFFGNTDEETVIASNFIAFYKGHLIIKVPGDSALSFGVIFLGDQCDANVLRHEYGHTVQLDELGVSDYFTYVALPSFITFALTDSGVLSWDDYYSRPWERQADEYGGAHHHYQPWASELSEFYWKMVEGFGGN